MLKVSVIVCTYNHSKYIRECLDSILAQKTNFDFEIILGEDESSDGTREICEKYKELYPNKINLFLRSRKDVIHINGKPTGRFNFLESLKAAKGKYIALCEGDDYWTDPLKLQKQVDFLETNPEYVVCCHNAKIIDEDGNLIQEKKRPKLNEDKNYSQLILKKGVILLTLSMVFRNVIKSFPSEFDNVINGDSVLISLLGHHGKGRYMENIEPAAYRIHSVGVWSHLDMLDRLKANRKYNHAKMDFYKDDLEVFSYYLQKQATVSRKLLRNLDKSENIKSYFDYNIFYIKYNSILKSKLRLKEFLKQNWFYWRNKIKKLIA